MTQITDAARTDLHNRVRDVLGEQEGDTLMAHLPPVGWADVATNDYVDHRAEVTEQRLTVTMERGFRRQAMWIATLFVAQAAAQLAMIAWAVDRLAP